MLPGIDQLDGSAEIFRLLLEGLSPEEANWQPAPDRWSIAEVLAHLAHVEGHCFRLRLDKILAESAPKIESYDQEVIAASGQYSGRDVEDSFDHWEDQRESNVEYLRSLPDSVAERVGRHEVHGEFRLRHMLNEWAFHDLAHIRQVAEIVRAVRYFPELGPFRSEYQVHP